MYYVDVAGDDDDDDNDKDKAGTRGGTNKLFPFIPD